MWERVGVSHRAARHHRPVVVNEDEVRSDGSIVAPSGRGVFMCPFLMQVQVSL